MILYEKTIESSYSHVDRVTREIVSLLRQKFQFMDTKYLFNVDFMLREILNNAVEHGNHFSEEKQVKVGVYYQVPTLFFVIEDEGKGFTEADIPTESHEPKSLLRERHRGHETLKNMDFDIIIKGNKVSILLNLNQEAKIWKSNY